MTRTQIRDLIARRLGSRTDLNTEIEDVIALVQESVLEGDGDFLPWFLHNPMTQVVLPEDEFVVSLPANFLRPVEGAIFRIYEQTGDNTVTKLETGYLDPGQAFETNTDAGRPTAVSIIGDSLYFDLPADEDYVIYFPAYLRQPTLSASIGTNAWTSFGADWMINECVKYMAERLQQPKLVELATARASEAKGRLFKFHGARISGGGSFQMGISTES